MSKAAALTSRVAIVPGDAMSSFRYVLVVDDAAEQRLLTRELLEDAGYVVVEAEHGRAALEHLLSADADLPALMLLDIAMPVMTGWELLAIVKSDPRLASVPVIIVSGEAAPARDAVRHGVVQLLAKPFTPDALLEAVRAIVRT